MKILDNFVRLSRKKIGEETKILICEKPLATLIAAAHRPCNCYKSEIFHVLSITFKEKTSACGSQVGHIQIALWVSGSTGVTHFQPCC